MANKDDWDDSVAETEQKEEDQPDITRFEILNYPADMTLAGYKEQVDNEQIITPEFQRKYVWDQVRASKLIESFLLGLPVPGVFLFKGRHATKQLVIDGQQRISTVIAFFKGIFRNKKFILKSVHPEWEGKSFEDLSKEDQFKLSTAVMRATIIQQLDPEDQSSIYYIFERLNTGGVNLNPMEVRMCIAEGSFTRMLRELNSLPAWRNLLNKTEEDNRLRDVELILRVLALHEWLDDYEKPMKRFLNSYAERNKNKSDDWINQKKEKFIAAVNKAAVIADRPFHLKGKLNYAVLDSIMVALMNSNISDKGALIERYNGLVQNSQFQEWVAFNTSDKQQLQGRISLAEEMFSA